MLKVVSAGCKITIFNKLSQGGAVQGTVFAAVTVSAPNFIDRLGYKPNKNCFQNKNAFSHLFTIKL